MRDRKDGEWSAALTEKKKKQVTWYVSGSETGSSADSWTTPPVDQLFNEPCLLLPTRLQVYTSFELVPNLFGIIRCAPRSREPYSTMYRENIVFFRREKKQRNTTTKEKRFEINLQQGEARYRVGGRLYSQRPCTSYSRRSKQQQAKKALSCACGHDVVIPDVTTWRLVRMMPRTLSTTNPVAWE